jgi:hypothetical protein
MPVRGDDCTSSKKQLTCNQDVGEEREENEHAMSDSSMATIDDLQKSVAARRILLDFAS